MPEKPTYISQSQLTTYISCSAHYLFRYICDIRIPPRAIMAQGSAVHYSLAEGYKHVMSEHELPPIDYMIGNFETDFSFRMESEVELTKKDEKPGKLKDEGITLLSKYYIEKMPSVKPTAAELKFEVNFKNKDFSLLGFIDLIDDGWIVDHKVVGQFRKAELENNQQLSAYSFGYRELFGKAEKGLRFDFLIRGKNPRIESVKTKRTMADHKRFLTNVAYIKQAIDTGQFFCFHHPANTWICSKDWCAYEERGLHKELYKLGVNKFIEKYGG